MPKRYLGNIITDTPTEPTANAANGVWSIADVETFKGAVAWPTLPEAPSIGTATDPGTGTSASVAFTAPELYGGTVSQYTATSNPGSITGTGSSSPVTVSGLTAGTAYTFTVAVTTGAGTGPSSSASNSVTPTALERALFAGGTTSGDAQTNTISYLDLDSTGNATDFGDLSSSRDMGPSGMASNSRAVFSGGGRVDYGVNTIEYATFASTGNTTDFGDSTAYQAYPSALSSSTRGVSSGGYNKGSGGGQGTNDYSNIMEYITIASTGNATDFGDMISVSGYNGRYQHASFASTTRGIMAAGRAGLDDNVIQYITIASTGNGTDFGDANTNSKAPVAGASNSTRGLFGADYSNTGVVVAYVTIASTGNSTDFGDLSVGRDGCAAVANTTKCFFAGGNGVGGYKNIIDNFTIASTGNATDWGDLTIIQSRLCGVSSAHGGIS